MASACYDSAGLWLIYGGWTGAANSTSNSSFLSDLWSFHFNSSTWQLVVQPADATEAPPPRNTANYHTAHWEFSGRPLIPVTLHAVCRDCVMCHWWQYWTPKQPCRTSCYSSTSQRATHRKQQRGGRQYSRLAGCLTVTGEAVHCNASQSTPFCCAPTHCCSLCASAGNVWQRLLRQRVLFAHLALQPVSANTSTRHMQRADNDTPTAQSSAVHTQTN